MLIGCTHTLIVFLSLLFRVAFLIAFSIIVCDLRSRHLFLRLNLDGSNHKVGISILSLLIEELRHDPKASFSPARAQTGEQNMFSSSFY